MVCFEAQSITNVNVTSNTFDVNLLQVKRAIVGISRIDLSMLGAGARHWC